MLKHERGSGKHPESRVSRTIQSDAEVGNINAMAAKYFKQRLKGNPDGRQPMFIDVPSESFHEMLNKVTAIQETFRRIPARLRARFANSPAVLMDWLKDPQNRVEAVRMGLINDPEIAAQLQQAAFQASQEAARRQADDPFDQVDLVDEADKADSPVKPGSKPPQKGGKERK